jgi:pimeloyl-ACP methyl ester carboxylesterase
VSELPVTSHSVRLADGRRLAVTDVGPRDGLPVVYLHGAIGAPLRCGPPLDAAIDELGVRMLLPQRPGFGASDQHPGRTLSDFAVDLEQVADALDVARFAVVGVSAGGPYAIACAHHLPGRVPVTAAVSSLSPLCAPADVPDLPARIRLPLRAIGAAPGPAAWLGDRAVGLVARHPELLVRAMACGAPAADRSHLADDAASRATVTAFLTATTGGIAGLVQDHLVTSRPWDFDLHEVTGEVHVWHGMGDAFVPAEHALQLVAALPRCRAFLDPGEGHFFFRRRVRDVLGALVDALERSADRRDRLRDVSSSLPPAAAGGRPAVAPSD